MKRLVKSIVCFLLVGVMFVSSLIGSMNASSVTVYADSNDRIKAFIQLAANGSATEGSLDNLTEEEIRFLGIFLSNYYVPFATEISSHRGSELSELVKNEMIEALTYSTAYSEELAEALIEIIETYCRSSLNKLHLYIKLENGDYYDMSNVIDLSYYNFSRIMMGRSDDVLNMILGSNYWDNAGQESFLSGFNIMRPKDGLPMIADKYGRYPDNSSVGSVVDFKDMYKDTNLDDNEKSNLNAINMALYSEGEPSPASSEGNEIFNSIYSDDVIIFYQIKCGLYDKFYMGFEDDENIKIVFDAEIGNNYIGLDDDGNIKTGKGNRKLPVTAEGGPCIVDYTASQIAYFKCMESTDLVRGYGMSLYDVDADEQREYLGDTNAMDAAVDAYTDTEKYKLSNFYTPMYVDCFGDIIACGSNHQVIVTPACMNPYTWISVDEQGNDIEGTNGSSYTMINAISIGQAQESESKLIKNVVPSDELDSEKGLYSFTPNFDIFNNKLKEGKLDAYRGCFKSRFFRGNGNYEFDTTSRFLWCFIEGGSMAFVRGTIRGYYIEKVGLEVVDADDTYKPDVNNPKYGGIAIQALDGDHKYYGWAGPRATEDGALGIDENYYDKKYLTSLLSKVVFIDNLGTYLEDGKPKEYNAFNVAHFINDEGKIGGSVSAAKVSEKYVDNLLSAISSSTYLANAEEITPALSSTLYVTYCWASLYNESNKKDTIGKLGYRLCAEVLPKMNSNSVKISGILDDMLSDQAVENIKNWTYYLLHPTDGYQYVVTLVRNKVNHILLGWHYDMTGTNGVGVNTGTTKYRSTMGYVTMPDLSEIAWTNSLIDFYQDCIPFFIILLIIIMVFAFVTKAVGAQQAIAGVLLFSVFTLLPVNLINATVQESNRLTQNIYGQKFTYWALVQQESYANAIDEVANQAGSDGSSSYENYLRSLYASNSEVYSNQGGDSILLKWQAPKKMASLVLSEKDSDSLGGLSSVGRKMLSGMLDNAYGGQTFLDSDEANYLYRSYTDISNFSRYIYRGIASNDIDKRVAHSSVLGGSGQSSGSSSDISFNSNFYNYWNTIDLTYFGSNRNTAFSDMYSQYVQDGYTNGGNFKVTSDGYTESSNLSDTFYMTVPLSSSFINNIFKEYSDSNKKISNYSNSNNLIPINQDVFNFGIPMFNGGLSTDGHNPFDVENLIATGGFSGNSSVDKKRQEDLRNYVSGYKESDYTGLAAYGLYSENPYYYFSWKLYSDGMNYDSSLSDKNFKDIILDRDNGGYFYNTKGNGELKDFMNMKGLFCTIIPYMKQCNDYVHEWDNVFGVFTYDGVPTEEGHWDEVKDDPELASKYWHNLNVSRLYMIYSPWVDVMYDCSYAKAETITVLGEKVTIEDPINPYSYPKDRPMIFSRSEMVDYGLGEGDLTKVEKLILSCNDQFQDRLYELLNYYTFSDVSLNSAAAINCAFVFNNTFSESGIFTDNHNIYPQAFDIANFSYDAFLRLALSNGTGENLLSGESNSGTYAGTTTGDFYERVVNNSSILTVIIMLILDIVSIYVIPAIRIFFLIALFVAIILLTLVAALKIEENMKFVRKMLSRFFIPLILFFITTIAFSFLLSFFMGSPANSVTQTSNFNISLGDPVMTMLAMLAMNIILIIIYWKIIKGVLKDLKERAGQLKSFGAGLGSAAVGFVGGLATAGISGTHKLRNEFSEFGRDIRSRRDSKNLKKTAENGSGGGSDAEKPAQNGTGVESGRANSRGSNGRSASSEVVSSGVDKDSRTERPTVSEENQKAINDALTKRSDIDAKAKEGSEYLKDRYKDKKNKYRGRQLDRLSKFDDTVDKKYGYARDESTGDIDTSKLTRRDKKSYARRADKFVRRETSKISKENKKLSKMVSKDRESVARTAKKRYKVSRKGNG